MLVKPLGQLLVVRTLPRWRTRRDGAEWSEGAVCLGILHAHAENVMRACLCVLLDQECGHHVARRYVHGRRLPSHDASAGELYRRHALQATMGSAAAAFRYPRATRPVRVCACSEVTDKLRLLGGRHTHHSPLTTHHSPLTTHHSPADQCRTLSVLSSNVRVQAHPRYESVYP
jgi:hypothetical protein